MNPRRSVALVIAAVVLALSAPASAQMPPPPIGVQRALQVVFDLFVRALVADADRAIAHPVAALPARCRPLVELVPPGRDRAGRAHALADAWRGQALIGAHIDGDTAEASVGPVRPSMTGLCFRRGGAGWTLVGWRAGE